MSALKKLETGVPGLDVLTLGGIPEGRSTLIVGKSGTGKTVIGLQIAGNLARQGIPTIMVAVEESPEDMQDSGDTLGLGISRLVRSGALHFTDITRMDGPTMIAGEYDLFGLVHRLEAQVKKTGARALVLDSATALFSPRPSEENLRSHFFQLVYTLRRLGLTAVIIAEAPGDYGQLTTMGVEDYVCDLTVILRNITDGGRRRRSIEVNKYRRSAHYKGEYPCTITTRGLAVFPLDAKENQDASIVVERYSSGVEGLDEMTRGGWLRNSIIIVRGPTGSGKTMLSGLYARAGAARGERVVYYGFEETRPILLRNYREMGMDMEPYIRSGNLKVLCRYPEATSLEDLLVDLRLGLEELKPSLIVLDSISSIEHASSEKGFRQFMIGVASVLREYGRSALITQTVASVDMVEHSAPYLSTIADAILTLDYSMDGYELDRRMRVIKMRGSDHEQHPYSLEIRPGGLRVQKLTPEEARIQESYKRRATDRIPATDHE
jgi:circadian clock protein KaiC